MIRKTPPFIYRSTSNSRDKGDSLRHINPDRTSTQLFFRNVYCKRSRRIKSTSRSRSPYSRPQNFQKHKAKKSTTIINLISNHNH